MRARQEAAVEFSKIGDPDDGGFMPAFRRKTASHLHTACADLPKYKTYAAALAAAEKLKARHPTAHVPTLKELDQNLFNNRNIGRFKDTFNTSGSDPVSVYRSSELFNNPFHARCGSAMGIRAITSVGSGSRCALYGEPLMEVIGRPHETTGPIPDASLYRKSQRLIRRRSDHYNNSRA